MADNEITETSGKGRGSILLVLFAVVVGVAAGGGGGLFAAKTVLAESRKDTLIPAEAQLMQPLEGSSSAQGNPADAGPVHLVENIVLNPAESRGTRYLMVTVGFTVRDEALVESMQAREPEVRDALMAVFGSKTVTELADIMQRDSLKAEVIEGVRPLFPNGQFEQVYFPQFVIQ